MSTLLPCKRSQFLVVETKMGTQSGEERELEQILLIFKYLVPNVPETQVHFYLSQVLVGQISFNSDIFSLVLINFPFTLV